MSIDGRDLAQAWNEWKESPEGQKCQSEGAHGEYLLNRLWFAFMAGAKVAGKVIALPVAQRQGTGE